MRLNSAVTTTITGNINCLVMMFSSVDPAQIPYGANYP